MRNSVRSVLLLVAMAASCPALAETPAQELARIETETMLLKARDKQLGAQLQLVNKQADIAAKQAEVSSKQTAASRMVGWGGSSEVSVVSIEGIGKKFYATVLMGNGSTVEVKKGDLLPNGMRIVSIGPDEVLADTGGKHHVRLDTAIAPPPSVMAQPRPFNEGPSSLPPPSPSFGGRGVGK